MKYDVIIQVQNVKDWLDGIWALPVANLSLSYVFHKFPKRNYKC